MYKLSVKYSRLDPIERGRAVDKKNHVVVFWNKNRTTIAKYAGESAVDALYRIYGQLLVVE